MSSVLRSHVVAIVVCLHLLAGAVVIAGNVWAGLGLGAVLFAYSRGLLHALDADHLCMIDGSTRKLLGEGRDARGIGLAFSLGHSTVVMAAGVAIIAGSRWVRGAIDGESTTAFVLGTIGASVSALYLLAVAAANVPLLVRSVRGRREQHGHQQPVGAWARLLAGPLSRVRHAGHVYLFGFLFGLGFDTASTIAVLMLTTSLSLTGASTVTLLALPLAFTAAMTLGDSINASVMRRVYSAAGATRRRLDIALLLVSILSALIIGGSSLIGVVSNLSGHSLELDAAPVGWTLVAVAVLGGLWLLVRRAPIASVR